MRLVDVAAFAAITAFVGAKHLTPDCLAVVYQRMVELNKYSWENGTRAQATLEWKNADLSVFAPFANSILPDALTTDQIPEIMDIANHVMDKRPVPSNATAPHPLPSNGTEGSSDPGVSLAANANAAAASSDKSSEELRRRQEAAPSPTITSVASAATSHPNATSTTSYSAWVTPVISDIPNVPQGSPLLNDRAAGDPPSLGIAVMLADKATNGAVRNHSSYGQAATDQLNFLLYHVPRTPNGAISHREWYAQLWADNVYMVPPFLAYYGLVQNNKTLLDESYNQIKKYREMLQDTDTKLWRHMTLAPDGNDTLLWATGNAWVTAGAARVIATIKHSSFQNDMKSEVDDLHNWADEVFKGTQPHVTENGLLRNYINNESSFEDSCSSALMAAAGLRFSTMNITNDYVDMSLKLLAGASRNVNSTGYLNNVTNPLKFVSEGNQSPEGQSFLLLAYAAYNDWNAMGKPGNKRNKTDPLSDIQNEKSSAMGLTATPFVATLLASLVWVLA